jgi:hypothetical protein
MTGTQTQSHVRLFTEEDIPEVVDVYLKVTGKADHTPETLNSYRTYFSDVFMNHPWRDEAIGSLVHQEADGRITGYVGVVPRQMSVNGTVLRAAILCEIVADPSGSGWPGFKLMSAALSGPQDLSISDQANSSAQKLIESLGASTSYLYSTRWTYPLRPLEFARYSLKKEDLLSPFFLTVSSPLARALDTVVSRTLKHPSPPPADLLEEELTSKTLYECLSESGDNRFLRPKYDYRSLCWLLERANRLRKRGTLQKVLVRTEKQEIAGWYLYYANPQRPSEVLQLFARPRFVRGVMEHLFYHAWKQGAIAVCGRLEPDLKQVVQEKHCLCTLGPDWVLVHSRRPELVRAFVRGEARFSRLDGELPLHRR